MEAGVRLLAPLRHRDFALLWTARTVSLAGDGVFSVALTWQALALPSPARALSLVLLARFAASTALLLAGGVASDRLSRRATMLGCEAAQGLAVGGLAVVTLTGTPRLWHLVAVAAVAGAAYGFFVPASTALAPQLVPRDLLVAANSLDTVSRLTAARLAGPALGGLLVAAGGAGLAFAVDAATFGASVVLLAALRVPPREAPADRGRLWRDVREGVAYCVTRRWLAVSLLAFAVLNLAVGAPLTVLVPLYVTDHLRLGARELGLLLAVEGAGGAVAALVAARARGPRRYVVAAHASSALAGVAVAALALGDSVVVAAAALALAGCLLELGNVYWATALQERVPNALLGRVSSVDWLLSGSLFPLGLAVVAAAADATSVATVLGVGGVLNALCAGAAAVALRAAPDD
jgi:DHA3 family tetracycline resistance protein-like MFS transporter